jgi:diguanylate cyclase (GGDEF)-like protein
VTPDQRLQPTLLIDVLERELRLSKQSGNPVSLLMIDVDHFKYINDKYGHQTGDVILKNLVDLITLMFERKIPYAAMAVRNSW